jgi:2-(1,2-epoxy-1,2-dihydrophenyl)acetyl-CoA isomerase
VVSYPSAGASHETVLATLSDAGLLTLTLNRPEKQNSVNDEMVAEINEVIGAATSDERVRCLLITGAGKAFCAGRDISSAKPGEDAYAIITEVFNPMLAGIYEFPKPSISAVNGAAMGVGLGIALGCDIVLAADNARFSSPFARLGAALDSGGHYLLPRRVGYGRAMEMVYTSDMIRGRQAADWGLANRSVAGSRLAVIANELGERIARGPLESFIGQKALMRRSETLSYAEVAAEEATLQQSLMESPEYAEGLRAFNEKRPPDFTRLADPAAH